MSQPLLPAKAPCAAADCTPEWISMRAEIIKRDGHQVRRGYANSIEVSGREGSWLYLTLPGEVTQFANAEDRDGILKALTQP